MRARSIRLTLPVLIGFSLAATLACLTLAIHLGDVARQDARSDAIAATMTRADALARQIESDVALFDLALRDAEGQERLAGGQTPSRIKPLEHPLTAKQIAFINILNEVGDVIADSRPNASRPANFAGRDYFQDHLKNPADVLMIGRPFATVPPENAEIPITRRLKRPDGGFGGVVVAGVRLAWLRDLLAANSAIAVTIRRDDGVILMRSPFEADDIGRVGATDPAWEAFRRNGISLAPDDAGGVRTFRVPGALPLVLELTPDPDVLNGTRPWLIWLPLLAAIPGLCVLGLSLAALSLRRGSLRVGAAARQANDDRMRLLATMSHELRTPLTGILGQAELLRKEGELDARQSDRLARLTEAGTMMRDIVNRVLDIARPEDHVITPVLAVCDLDQLIRASRGMVEAAARVKGLSVTGFVDPSAPRFAKLDRGLVEQVLINLLMNAVKFTSRGTITVRLFGEPEQLRFEVADTGPGIPVHKRYRLFREHDRLDAGDEQAGGSGLGLSITERIVSRLGGQIGHMENPGGGSVFWVTLPFLAPGAETHDPEPAIEPDPTPETKPLRILVADDMDVTRTVTADFLRAAGHDVTEAEDGEAALRKAQIRDFDMLLTDMRMPGCDGLETARRIRSLPGRNGRIPVVLLTADLAARRHGIASGAGVDLCLMKPFRGDELLEAVHEAASLVPPPDRSILDDAALSQLLAGMGRDAADARLDAVARRIADLLTMLDTPDADPMECEQAAHDLVGVTGLMGLTALSTCLAAVRNPRRSRGVRSSGAGGGDERHPGAWPAAHESRRLTMRALFLRRPLMGALRLGRPFKTVMARRVRAT